MIDNSVVVVLLLMGLRRLLLMSIVDHPITIITACLGIAALVVDIVVVNNCVLVLLSALRCLTE